MGPRSLARLAAAALLALPAAATAGVMDGLLAYYQFNGNGSDLSGNDYYATVNGAALAPDRQGSTGHAYSYDGLNDYLGIGLPVPPGLRPTGALTVSAWVYPAGYGNIWGADMGGIIASQWDAELTGFSVQLDFRDAPGNGGVKGGIHFQVGGGTGWWGGDTQGTTALAVPLDRWTHVACVAVPGSRYRVYLDGALAADWVPGEAIAWGEGGRLAMGWNENVAGSRRHFGGRIDDVRIYSRALSDEEVLFLSQYQDDNYTVPTDIVMDSSLVAENQPAGTPVGNFATCDANPGDAHTYGLAAGEGDGGNPLFGISGNVLLTAGPLDFEAAGSLSVRVRSTDASGLWCEEAFTVGVTDVDEAVTLEPVGDRSVEEGRELVITLLAHDPEGGPLTFSAANLPAGASFDPGTAAFTWTPGYDQAGSYPGIRFEVTDGEFTDFEEIAVTVTDHDALIFADDFSDGNAGGDPDWEVAAGGWSVSPVFTYVASARKPNRALVRGVALLEDYGTGVLEAKVRLPRTAVKAPNGALLFHVADGANYRYARLRKTPAGGKLILGQAGDPAGDGSGSTSSAKKVALRAGRFYTLRLHLWPDGLVEAFLDGVKVHEAAFGPAAGRVGLNAAKSKSVFDDVSVRDWTILP